MKAGDVAAVAFDKEREAHSGQGAEAKAIADASEEIEAGLEDCMYVVKVIAVVKLGVKVEQ